MAERKQQDRNFSLMRDAGRAFGGALIFSLPMLMTSEFWQLGFTIDTTRLLLFMLVGFPVLVGLSYQVGFKETKHWSDDVVDAGAALFVGALTATVVLACFGALSPDMSARELVGKVAIQTFPAAIGALLARSQFASDRDEDGEIREETYGGEMFIMAVGALFLGLNVSATEEVLLIAYSITPWHAVALALLSLAIVHGFVFAVGFRGGSQIEQDAPWWSAFLRFTLPGYILALAVNFYVLWTFHSADELPFRLLVFSAIVLGLPSSLGAAAARLIL